MERRVLVVVAVVCLVTGACGRADEVRTSPSASTRTAMATVEGRPEATGAEGDARVALTESGIAEAERRWSAAGIDDYRFVMHSECTCDWVGSRTITVVDDRVVEVVVAGGEPDRREFARTVPELFAMLRETFLDGMEGASAFAAFDPVTGRPLSLEVRWNPQDLFAAAIEDFTDTTGEPGPEPAEPPNLFVTLTNQSFEDPDVGIVVRIDGEVVIDASFAVEGQHHFVGYEFTVDPGDHDIAVTTDSGATRTTRVTVPDGAPWYVVVSHWRERGRPHVVVEQSAEPSAFG